MRRPAWASVWIGVLVLGGIAPGCQRVTAPGSSASSEAEASEETETERAATPGEGDHRAEASRRPPAGASCTGRRDCTSDQSCVEGICRYRETSAAAEVLASAARAQVATGDAEGAIESYRRAFEAFHEERAPVPPEVVCPSAELILHTASDSEARERGARQADLCFRTTVSGDPLRTPVHRALSRLRHLGLDLALFDRDDPAETFFTGEAGAPSFDVIGVEVQMPDLEPAEPASHMAIRRTMREDGVRTIAECFVRDWEMRHEETASAELIVRFATTVRNMGDHDVHEASVELAPASGAEEGFEPCLVGLTALFDPGDRSLRGEPWTQAVRIVARAP